MKKFPFFKPASAPRDLDRAISALRTKPASFWEAQGEKMVKNVYSYTREHVPSYRDMLKKNKISFPSLKNIKDLKKLPIVSKNSFLRPARYSDLFPDSNFSRITTISATSGSSGEPFYFPRLEENDSYYQYTSQLALVNQWDLKNKKTLAIIGFGMGIWIGGIFTYKCFNRISTAGYNLSLVPVGPNIDLFLRTVAKFAPEYDQIILMGYAPFIKDVVDQSSSYNIDWKKINVRVLTAAEGYSEKFKDYVAQKLYLKNIFTDFINIYGTVELGTMAQETPLSNLIRRLASENKDIFKGLFGSAGHLPTFGQYHPYLHYFEEEKGELLGTAYGTAMPLVRYSFPDRGGIHAFDGVIKILRGCGVDILKEAKKAGIEKTIFKLPFVYVIERADSSLVFRGANIYAEEVKKALLHEKATPFVTGKFTMKRSENEKMDALLEVHVELHNKKQPSETLIKELADLVMHELLQSNSEYAILHKMEGPDKVRPQIFLYPYGDQKYFRAGGKQRWKTE